MVSVPRNSIGAVSYPPKSFSSSSRTVKRVKSDSYLERLFEKLQKITF